MKKTETIRRFLSAILMLSMLFSMAVAAWATEEESPYPLSFHLNGEAIWLDSLKKNGTWYAQADELASLSGGKMDATSSNVTIIREKQSVPLYSTENIVWYEDEVYVPLAEASVSVGLEFFMNNGDLTAQQRKTPVELEALTSSIMRDDENNLSMKTPPYIWEFYLTTSRIWSILPIVGSSNIVLEVTGQKEKERYRDAYGELLSYQDPVYDCLAEIADDLDQSKDWSQIVTLANELLQGSNEAKQWFEAKGLTQEIVSSLSSETTPSIPGDSLLEVIGGVGKTVDTMKIPYALNTLAYLGAMWDAEASTITALTTSGKHSKNEAAQAAAEELREAYLAISNDTAIAGVLARVGADVGMNIAFGLASDFVWEKLNKGVCVPAELFGSVYDETLGISNKAEGVIGYTIFSNIQGDMLRYYSALEEEQNENQNYNLRAAAIVYLNAAVAGCNSMIEGTQSLIKGETDSSFVQTMNKAKRSYVTKLQSLLSFQEADCRQDYTNQAVLDWLEENYQKPITFPDMNAVNITVEPQEIQYPVKGSDQAYTFHYSLPVVVGSEPQIKVLNDTFVKDMESFSHATGRHERLALYADDEEWIENTWFLPGTVTAKITQNAGGVLSVRYHAHYIYDYNCAYGMTFDLKTGKQIPISQCFPQNKERIEAVVKGKLERLIQNSGIPKEEILECLDNFNLDGLQYYVDDGELIVISPEVLYADGSMITEDIPTGLMLDGSEKKAPVYMADYLGMTVGEVIHLWGQDYSVTGEWFLGGLYGFYYEDERVNALFYFSDPSLTGKVDHNAIIEGVHIWGKNTRITPDLTVGTPYEELIRQYDGEFSDGGGNFWEYCYEITIEDSIFAVFGWWDGYGIGDNNVMIFLIG